MNNPTPSKSPLRLLLEELPRSQRQALASLAATTLPYLYDIAAGTRTPSVTLALYIEDASQAIRVRTGGKSRIVTVREIADIKMQATESEKS